MKGKVSFQLYTEWLEIFEALSDEDAGVLVKHIFQYVNDKNPQTDNKFVQLSFIPIKQQLKRDLKKYLDKCATNKDNIDKRWKEKIPKDTSVSTPIRTRTKHTDKDKDKEKEEEKKRKEKKKKGVIFPFQSKEFLDSWDQWKGYKKKEHKFHYASEVSEQKALTKLSNISKKKEKVAIEILNESMANGWQGFFSIEQQKNLPSNIHRDNLTRDYGG